MTAEAEPIKVYVRGEEARRTLSFKCPERIPQKAFLSAGIAIDGNSALLEVGWSHFSSEWAHTLVCNGKPTQEPHTGLVDTLHCAELSLANWLDNYSYGVEFL